MNKPVMTAAERLQAFERWHDLARELRTFQTIRAQRCNVRARVNSCNATDKPDRRAEN